MPQKRTASSVSKKDSVQAAATAATSPTSKDVKNEDLFAVYLEKTGEVGYVTQFSGSIIYANGLPGCHPEEVVIFETGEIGYILSVHHDILEIILLSPKQVAAGARVVRTMNGLQINAQEILPGSTVILSQMEKQLFSAAMSSSETTRSTFRALDETKLVFADRQLITQPLETGVSTVDMLIPLGKGQRELVLGDRKTGKTNFLLQTLRTQVQHGALCIYALVGKPQLEIQRVLDLASQPDIKQNTIVVASHSADRAGLVHLTPYVAMTIAEHYKDLGRDVVLIIDDLTTHAHYYRELMLLAKRFPGRSSYPGDIFYVHARLLERAGNFLHGSLSCFPVAQSVAGDFSGFIQSNLMSMTDGHIFFDTNFFDQGRRPAINPFLSVTRVGEQTQSALQRQIGRHLRSFFVSNEKIKQFRHFQSELGENVRSIFETSERLTAMLDQDAHQTVPVQINAFLYGLVWSDFWKGIDFIQMKNEMKHLITQYQKDQGFHDQVTSWLQVLTTVDSLIELCRTQYQTVLAMIMPLRKGSYASSSQEK